MKTPAIRIVELDRGYIVEVLPVDPDTAAQRIALGSKPELIEFVNKWFRDNG